MPIEIKELTIKAVINQQGSQQSGSTPADSPPTPASTDKLVAECVEKVLEVLKQRNER